MNWVVHFLWNCYCLDYLNNKQQFCVLFFVFLQFVLAVLLVKGSKVKQFEGIT